MSKKGGDTSCTSCGGKGWICANVDNSGDLEIQRCDACFKYKTDSDAVEAVAEAATHWFDYMETVRKLQ